MVTDEDGKCDGMGSHLLIQSGGETIATQRWYLREYHTIIQPMNTSSIGSPDENVGGTGADPPPPAVGVEDMCSRGDDLYV